MEPENKPERRGTQTPDGTEVNKKRPPNHNRRYPAKKRAKIEADTDKLAKKILARQGHVTPSWKTRAFFTAMHFVQQKGWNEADATYWKQQGWTGSKRPWKE